jgi:prepilin-type N-terminal cleavage/methylation domain-containing protein/prepilin-type processing-associated H-X9-DG protein
MPLKSRRSAFTLIELLVVISIIAILAAILFPVFAQAREKARSTACLSNLKQIGLGMQMYGQDYDDGLPSWIEFYGGDPANPNDNGSTTFLGLGYNAGGGWQSKLHPYVKSGDPLLNTGVWRCPSQGSKGEPSSNVNPSYGMQGHVTQYNPRTVAAMGANPYYQYPKLSAMDNAATTIYIGEGGAADGRISSPRNHDFSSGTVNTREMPTRHHDGANYLFADGHAKWLKRENTYPEANNTARQWRTIYNYFAYNEVERTAAKTLCGTALCP